MQQIISDLHLHSNFSSDGKNTLLEMALAAEKKGLKVIAFTDHVDIDYPLCPESAIFKKLNATEYRQAVAAVREKMAGRVEILLGVETGLQPKADVLEKTQQFTEALSPDLIVASTHCVHHQELSPYDFFRNRTQKEAYQMYLEDVLANLSMTDNYDTAAHLDFIERYYPAKTVEEKLLRYEQFASVIDKILLVLIHKEKALEINTAGIRYGLGVPHPSLQILTRYRELGGKMITVGSDAHYIEDIAANFEIAMQYLQTAGFSSYCIYRNRIPEFRMLHF